MTKNQIETYEKCKKHLASINGWIEKIPYNVQMYGCGTGSPSIDFTLDNIHAEMYNSVLKDMNDAKDKIQAIIDKS